MILLSQIFTMVLMSYLFDLCKWTQILILHRNWFCCSCSLEVDLLTCAVGLERMCLLGGGRWSVQGTLVLGWLEYRSHAWHFVRGHWSKHAHAKAHTHTCARMTIAYVISDSGSSTNQIGSEYLAGQTQTYKARSLLVCQLWIEWRMYIGWPGWWVSISISPQVPKLQLKQPLQLNLLIAHA